MTSEHEQSKSSPPRPSLEDSAQQILGHLIRAPQGEDAGKLADIAGISVTSARKMVSLLSTIVNLLGETAPREPVRPRIAIKRSPRGTIVAARFERLGGGPPAQVPAPTSAPAISAVPTPLALMPAPAPAVASLKPTYALGTTDADAIQKLARLYVTTGRAFPPALTGEVDSLRARCPPLLARSATGNGAVPTPSLLNAAKALQEYSALGRLPEKVDTPAAVLTFSTTGGAPA